MLCVCVRVCGTELSRYSDWLRAGRSGIESRWGRDFPPFQIGPGAHPASCKVSIGSFPRVKCGRCVLLTTHPILVPRSLKSTAITLTQPLGHAGPVTGSLYLFYLLCVCVYIYIYIYIHTHIYSCLWIYVWSLKKWSDLPSKWLK